MGQCSIPRGEAPVRVVRAEPAVHITGRYHSGLVFGMVQTPTQVIDCVSESKAAVAAMPASPTYFRDLTKLQPKHNALQQPRA